MKKILALVLAFAMVFSSIPVVFADSVSDEAKALAMIGALKGDNGGVTAEYLAKAPTRLQAAIMLLRLKGLEAEAMAYVSEDNFEDVKDYPWVEGRNIMAYLKANPAVGFRGTDKGFEPNREITALEFYKVLLVSLGYVETTADVVGDFTWDTLKDKLAEVGLGALLEVTSFTNDHMAKATVEALGLKVKDSDVTLLGKLIEAGVVKEEDAIAAGLIEEKPVLEAALKSAVALGNTVVEVTFDGPVNAGAEDVTLYEIDGLTVEEAIVTGEDTVRLTTSAQEAGKKYTLTVGDVKVNFGGKAKVAGAPELKTVTGPDTNRVELVFDKTLDFVTATDVTNYEIKGVEIEKAELDDVDTVILVTKDMTPNKTYTVKVTGVKSVDGVALKSTSRSFYSRSDKTAPKVVKAEAMTFKRVLVKFDDFVTEESATNVENYTIKAGNTEIAVLSATLVEDDNDDLKWVELTTDAMKGGTSYKLTVRNIVDKSVLGNAMAKEQTVSFMGKSEDKNAPTVSKVETLSRHTLLLTLSDSSRLDWTTVEDVSNYTIDNDIVVEKAEKVAGTDADSKLVLLTVSALGEKSQYSLTVENLADEYGNTMSKASKIRVNYNKSNTNAAKVVNVTTKDLDTVIVEFSTYVDPVTAKDVANYSINKEIGVPVSAKVSSDLTKVTLKVNEMKEGTNYTLTIDGVKDLANNTLFQKPTFYARTLANDITAPEVTEIYAVNNRVIRVVFDEEIDTTKATTLVVYNPVSGGDDITFNYKASYEDGTVLEYSNATSSTVVKLRSDNEYKVKQINNIYDLAGNKLKTKTINGVEGIYDEYDNILYFWGNDNDPENIEFSWEQTAVNMITFTFTEKVRLDSANSNYITDEEYNGDPVEKDANGNKISDVWHYRKATAIKPGTKIIDGNINGVFRTVHGEGTYKPYLIVNEDGKTTNGKSTITADMEDDEQPYVVNVKANYRNEIVVEYNEELSTPGSYKLSYYDLAGKQRWITVTVNGFDSGDSKVYLTPNINLESRFEYELTVTTGAKDISNNQAEKDETYYFVGTDLVKPGNFIKGVTFTNGSIFAVNFTDKPTVTVKVYELDEDGDLGDLIVQKSPTGSSKVTFDLLNDGVDPINAGLLSGKNYRVVADGYDDYDFEGIVEEGINVEANFDDKGTADTEDDKLSIVISYDGADETDVVYVKLSNGSIDTATYNSTDKVFEYVVEGAASDLEVVKVVAYATEEDTLVLPLYYFAK